MFAAADRGPMPETMFKLGLGRGGIKPLVIGWLVAEVLALLLVVKVLGLGGAILLTLGTSALGVVLLRRLGVSAAQQVRNAVAGGLTRDGTLLDGTVAALGALLLIVPGFVTDLVGLALATPSVRQILLHRLVGSDTAPSPLRPSPSRPDVIDLSPADWTVVDSPRQP